MDSSSDRSSLACGESSISDCKSRLNSSCRRKAVAIEVLVDFRQFPGLPEMHQAVNAVDQWNRFASWSFISKRAAFSLCPGFELHFATGIFLDIGVSFGIGIRLFVVCFIRRFSFGEAD